ncbi:DMT family transporter [Rhodospirillum centenum]|nr:DMT family transporter [Rhodospirillum centenum]
MARTSTLAGILLFIATVFCFSVMDAMVKDLSARYGTWQIMFFRGLFSLLPIAVLVAQSGGIAALRTERPVSHLLRGLVGIATAFCFFYSYGHMPLADVYAIAFATPLMITALSVPLLGEHVGWRRWTAVLVGFVGVLIMLRPGEGLGTPVALVALAGAFFYALLMIYVRRLARTETTAAIVFYFVLLLCVLSAVMMLPDWRTPDTALDWTLLVATGILGGFGQILMTLAFRRAPPSAVAPFEYTGMIWAVFFGFTFFGEVPDPAIWIGGAIVIGSGLYILHREALLARRGR